MGKHHIYIASCARSGGVLHYTLEDGAFTFAGACSCPNPMYLDVGQREIQVILRDPFPGAQESGLGTIALDPGGRLGELGPLTGTRGEIACHLCRYRGRTYVTNYLSGSVFSTGGALDVHSGRSLHPVRQNGPYTHYVAPAPDGSCLLAVDLGLDAIYVYDEDLQVLDVTKLPGGLGPRHLAWGDDGSTIFCANELGSSVTVLKYEYQRLRVLQTVNVLDHPAEENYPAAIRVAGEYVYVSNRGDDSISCFHWDGETLRLRSVTPCGGAWPRDMLLVEDLLLCANERSHTVTVLRLSGETLTDTGTVLQVDTPICIAGT